MLSYKNNKLEYSGEAITSNNQTLILNTDLTSDDIIILGQLLFTDGSSSVMQFVKYSDTSYRTKLQLNKDIKKVLKNSKFKIILINGTNSKSSNLITFNFSIEKIELEEKETQASELEKINTRLQKLESTLSHLAKGHALDNINITNRDYIKKGMVLQAIDDNGNFVAVYPFNNMIEEINGHKATNNSIILDASMIKYNKDKNLNLKIIDIIETVEILNNTIETQSDIIVTLQTEVNTLKSIIETHINDGIV